MSYDEEQFYADEEKKLGWGTILTEEQEVALNDTIQQINSDRAKRLAKERDASNRAITRGLKRTGKRNGSNPTGSDTGIPRTRRTRTGTLLYLVAK